MRFSSNWLKELAHFKLSPPKLAEVLNIRSFEVESVEKIGGDWVLDAKIPTNRLSDAGHHWGMAREIASTLKLKANIPKNKALRKRQEGKQAPVQINVAPAALCPRYTAQILEIGAVGSSPQWMQERLTNCGMRPINVVVDITNYVMLETGQPLHAFDLDAIKGGRIVIRESKAGERLTTLDGSRHALPEGAIVIEDAERLIDLAGIMGGENSAVSSKTKRILLQAAAFDHAKIYRASRLLNLSSAASKIYSAGIDPNQTEVGLARAIEFFQDILGAKTVGAPIDIYPRKATPLRLLFRPEYASRIIGQDLPPIFYIETFSRLGFQVRKKGKNLLVEIPTIRRDIQIEEDLIEEAARIFGYEKLSPELPESPILPPPINEEYYWAERVRDNFVSAGFSESILYQFAGDQELEQFRIDAEDAVKLENPMNPETRYLLPRLLIKYAASAAENLRENNLVKIFGIGKSFRQKPNAKGQTQGVEERKELVLALAQKGTRGEEEFYQLKGTLDAMFESMGISDHWYGDQIELGTWNLELGLFHPYRRAEIKIGDEKIGMVGEIHPDILKNIKAKARIVAAEIDMEKLARLATAESEFRPIGKYPSVIRDIAVVVPASTKTEEILNVIENVGGALLIDTDLFDYFQDDALRESDQKSLAFHLVFQSPDRTLTDLEVDGIMEKIQSALERQGWKVRK